MPSIGKELRLKRQLAALTGTASSKKVTCDLLGSHAAAYMNLIAMSQWCFFCKVKPYL